MRSRSPGTAGLNLPARGLAVEVARVDHRRHAGHGGRRRARAPCGARGGRCAGRCTGLRAHRWRSNERAERCGHQHGGGQGQRGSSRHACHREVSIHGPRSRVLIAAWPVRARIAATEADTMCSTPERPSSALTRAADRRRRRPTACRRLRPAIQRTSVGSSASVSDVSARPACGRSPAALKPRAASVASNGLRGAVVLARARTARRRRRPVAVELARHARQAAPGSRRGRRAARCRESHAGESCAPPPSSTASNAATGTETCRQAHVRRSADRCRPRAHRPAPARPARGRAARDPPGQHAHAHVVLAERHVRAVLLGAADRHQHGRARRRDALAQLDRGQLLEPHAGGRCMRHAGPQGQNGRAQQRQRAPLSQRRAAPGRLAPGRRRRPCRRLERQSSSSPPRTPPSSPPAAEAAAAPSPLRASRRAAAPPRTRALARRENGRLCSQTVPGPVSLAKNRPSPPNSAVLILPTYWISKLTFGV